MYRQRGVTLSGFMMIAVVLIFVALLGFRIGPPYLEYLTIKKQFQAIASDPAARGGQRREVEEAFSKRAMIEDMPSVNSKDLVITKEGDGIVISAEYSVCRPVVANIRACMDFAPTSRR
jgi:hypothetical protein